MLRVFQNDILNSKRFVITMELVPGREPAGRSVDSVKGMAADAFADGRVSAVSITDNPGGNPALSPDVIGHDIFKVGWTSSSISLAATPTGSAWKAGHCSSP